MPRQAAASPASIFRLNCPEAIAMTTRPVTALIADDEEAPRAQLAAALQTAWPGLQLVAPCVNGVDAWDAWLEHEPQVCFLDIRMPGMSGIEVARRIGGRTPVVFVTAFGDHALAAFDAGAVDYVMKPVDPQRLAQAVERVRTRLDKPALDPAGLQALLAQLAGRVRRPGAGKARAVHGALVAGRRGSLRAGGGSLQHCRIAGQLSAACQRRCGCISWRSRGSTSRC
jgi:CheY-like chemotaxis protein